MMKDLSSEFNFSSSRSGGKGGQNVNKVNSKVLLSFNVGESSLLSDDEKKLILDKCSSKINAEGFLQIVSQTERTQLSNKKICIDKFYALIQKALTPVKKRKKTKPSKAVKEKRLTDKKKQSEKKQSRKFDS